MNSAICFRHIIGIEQDKFSPTRTAFQRQWYKNVRNSVSNIDTNAVMGETGEKQVEKEKVIF